MCAGSVHPERQFYGHEWKNLGSIHKYGRFCGQNHKTTGIPR